MKIRYLLLLAITIGLKLVNCEGTFKARSSYLNSIAYTYTHPDYTVGAQICDIIKVKDEIEGNLNCMTDKGNTIDCSCSGGTVGGLEPDTEYALIIKSKPNTSPTIMQRATFKTSSKYYLKWDKIDEDSYEYSAQVDSGKEALDECRVCLVEGGTEDRCCTTNYNTNKRSCTKKDYTGLKFGTVYDFIMCDINGGQSIKKRIITTGYPKKVSVNFDNDEVSYLLTYRDEGATPIGPCVGSFVGQESAAKCKDNYSCNCTAGIFLLPTNMTNLRFQLKILDQILVDYTPEGPGPNNPVYYTATLKGRRLTTSQYTITAKKEDLEQLTCNFYTHEDIPVKCQGEDNTEITDCTCAQGNLVGLSPNTDYKIKVVLKATKETILSDLILKTAGIGKITDEYIGLNKYKYKVSYSDEKQIRPDQCRICLTDRASTDKCCTGDYYTKYGGCSTFEFTVKADMPRSLRFKMCDLDGSVMINHDVGIPLVPTLKVIILYKDRIRYKLTYENNIIPKGCKFFINDTEKMDLLCVSNKPCDCEKGAFKYTDEDQFKFTIKDMEGNELASKELDKSKKDEYFQNKDEACTTFGI